MTDWTVEQLDAIDRADELEVITVRADGTPRRPVPIWVVRVGDAIYVRSYRGDKGSWYRHARKDGVGRARVAGFEEAVEFELITDRDAADSIDAAYSTKYARYGDSYVKPMLAQAARAATLRLTRRED